MVCTFYSHFLFLLFLTLCGVLNSSSAVAQFRLVVKTAMKLLLVFVEYSESNAPHLIEAITSVDTKRGAICGKRCVTFARFFYYYYYYFVWWVVTDQCFCRLQAVVQHNGNPAGEGRSGHGAAGLRHDAHQQGH